MDNITLKKDVRLRIYKELIKVRQEKGLSQSDVALQTNISLQKLNDMENGGVCSWKKIRNLLYFYHKDWKIELIDR
jgi:transcriptional regulator with XRE-family HTH domain